MQNLLVKPTSRWEHFVSGQILTVTHPTETGLIGVAWIENGKIVLGTVTRHMLIENYNNISEEAK